MHVREKDFQSYLDNSLDYEKRRETEQHILVCEECRQKLEEWKNLFEAINGMEAEFSLDGLEEKVLRMIKEKPMAKKEKDSRFPVLVLASSFLIMIGMLFSPFVNIAGLSFRYASNFLLNESIDFINTIKWKAIDFMSGIRFDGLDGWPLLFAAGIILIAGGIYLSLGRKRIIKT